MRAALEQQRAQNYNMSTSSWLERLALPALSRGHQSTCWCHHVGSFLLLHHVNQIPFALPLALALATSFGWWWWRAYQGHCCGFEVSPFVSLGIAVFVFSDVELHKHPRPWIETMQ